MKPFVHSLNSVKRYGGVPTDYQKIHDWFDSTKSTYADVRHRAILHSAFGIYLCEQVFGTTITNSDGKQISVRNIAEDHVAEDFGGKIPSIQDWLEDLPLKNWMKGAFQKEFVKKFDLTYD